MSDATTSQSHDKGHHHGPNHDYHLLDPSVWPLFCSIAALVLFVSLTGLLEGTDAFSIKVPFTGIALVDIQSGVPFGLLTTISLLVLVFGMFGWLGWFGSKSAWHPEVSRSGPPPHFSKNVPSPFSAT